MTRRIMIALASFVLLLVLGGCGGSTSDGGQVSPAPGTTAPTAPGTTAPGATTPGTTAPGGTTVNAETVYKSNCLACHGTNLEGSMGPKLSDVGTRLSEEQIAGILKDGRGNMPAFKSKLSNDEIAGLSTWLAAKK